MESVWKDLREDIESSVSIGMLARTSRTRIPCPFHNSVAPDLQILHHENKWRCWGKCAATHPGKRSIFDWVMLEQGVDFSGAFKILAEEAGISIMPNQERVRILSEAQDFYYTELQSHDKAKQYLTRRGFGEQLIFQRRLGFASADSMPTLSIRDLDRVGLMVPGMYGPYLQFQDRLVYPVYDMRYNIVQMQGRLIAPAKNETTPKYKALPEEKVELRGRSIYQCLAGEELLKRTDVEDIVLCEGWPDRETLFAWGFNSVSLFGNKGMAKHAHKFKHVKRIHVVLDPDEASQNFILNELFALQCRAPQIEIRNVKLDTDGTDLNDWAISGNVGKELNRFNQRDKVEQFQGMLDSSKPLVEELIDVWGNNRSYWQMLLSAISISSDVDKYVHAFARMVNETPATIRFAMSMVTGDEG